MTIINKRVRNEFKDFLKNGFEQKHGQRPKV